MSEEMDQEFSNKVLNFKRALKVTKYCSRTCMTLDMGDLDDSQRDCLRVCGQNFKLTYVHFQKSIKQSLLSRSSGF